LNKERIISGAKIIATLLLLVFSIYFAVWKVDFRELGDSFRHADYQLALLIIPIILAAHWIRAVRWRVMLRSLEPRVPLNALFGSVIIGYFLNNIIPRSGEIARPYLLSQSERNLSFSSLLGTIIVERFIDSIALLIIVASVLMFDRNLLVGFDQFEGAVKALLYPAIVLGIVFVLIAPSAAGMKLAETLARPLPARLRGRILGVFIKLQKGFGVIKTRRQLALIVFQTAIIYLFYLLPLYVMFFAFPGGDRTTPSFFDAARILAITAMAVAVAPTPGAFGVFHVSARIAVMKLLGFTYADAVAFATITHFMQFFPVMALGAYYLVAQNVSLVRLLQRKSLPAG